MDEVSAIQKMQDLEAAVRVRDDRTRPARIDRIVWIADHEQLPPVIMGRTETLHMLNEARQVFIDGHFASSLLTAFCVINHSLVEELQLRGVVRSDPGFAKVLRKCEAESVLPKEWIEDLTTLFARRNPFAHFKDSGHAHGLGARIRLEQAHSAKLLEDDARTAVKYMYLVFRSTLREIT